MRRPVFLCLALGLCHPGALRAQAPEPPPAGADVEALRKELEALRQAHEEQQRRLDEKIRALQSRIDELEKSRPQGALAPAPSAVEGPASATTAEEKKKLEEEFQKALAGDDKKTSLPPQASSSAPSLRLIDISFGLLATAGSSTAAEADVRRLDAGDHDPKSRGFTVQNAELTLGGVVDPFFRGDANIVWKISQDGESEVELEEAYLTTLALPANLQARAGQFFTAFGRLNPMHPHAWDFVDQPVVNSRFFGPDGLRNPGLQVSWLTPLPFFAELTGSVQDAHGETAASFRGAPDDAVAGRTLLNRNVHNAGDLLYLARLKTSFDPTDEITLVPAVSAAFGPNGSGLDTQTRIYGVDLYAKWKPLTNNKGWPFMAWQTEAMLRRYEAGAVVVNDVDDDGLANGSLADGTVGVGRETLHDWGLYTQAVWGFARPWAVGVRYDYAAGEVTRHDLLPGLGVDRRYDSTVDFLRDRRHRLSAALTYYPSEFSKIRLQYAYDSALFLEDAFAHSVWLQAEILFGAHGAHKF